MLFAYYRVSFKLAPLLTSSLSTTIHLSAARSSHRALAPAIAIAYCHSHWWRPRLLCRSAFAPHTVSAYEFVCVFRQNNGDTFVHPTVGVRSAHTQLHSVCVCVAEKRPTALDCAVARSCTFSLARAFARLALLSSNNNCSQFFFVVVLYFAGSFRTRQSKVQQQQQQFLRV